MRSRLKLALLFAALAVAARIPFLISAKIAFDSDEAVEGLMARHVLQGELPAFYWGQAFKGVPEVYVSAGAFALFGPSIALLKSVTLLFFAVYVALNFTLLDRIASRWVAVGASLALLICPPALVFWTLDGSAEFIVLMLLGTLLLLTYSATRSRLNLWGMGFTAGLALWTQQLFVVYLAPLAIIWVVSIRPWQHAVKQRVNPVVFVLLAGASVYLTFGVIAFFTGGFAFAAGGTTISVRPPQKLARIAALLLTSAAVVHVLLRAEAKEIREYVRRYWPVVAGFITGYLPVILYSVLVEPARSPARNANLEQLMAARMDIFGNIVPILFGFKLATTQRSPIPAIFVVPVAAPLVAYVWSQRGRLRDYLRLHPSAPSVASDFFPLFVVLFPLIFLGSAAYLDTQSYRYLIPWYAGLSVAWSAGCLVIARGRKAIASLFLGFVLCVHAWQQVSWYRQLSPDMTSATILDCLNRRGIRGGFADYWTAYTLTFISGETTIVAPSNAVDRYPPYSVYVRSLPSAERLDDVTTCNDLPHR